jgi:hypothetical protein
MASLLASDIAVVVFIGIFRRIARAIRHGITTSACPSLNIEDDPPLLTNWPMKLPRFVYVVTSIF